MNIILEASAGKFFFYYTLHPSLIHIPIKYKQRVQTVYATYQSVLSDIYLPIKHLPEIYIFILTTRLSILIIIVVN